MSARNGGLRKRRAGGFVSIPSTTIRDKELSFRARGVLGWILDHPDGWDIRSEVIAHEGAEGREAIRTALAELAAHGYYRVERRRQADGQVLTVTAVSDTAMPDWAAEYRADQAGAGKRKDGSTARRRAPLYVQAADGEWVRATPRTAPTASETVTAEGGFPGSGSPGSGSPGAGNLGSLVQTETQTVTTTTGPKPPPGSPGTDPPDPAAPLALVVVESLPNNLRTGLTMHEVVKACRPLAGAGWSPHQMRAAVLEKSWFGAHSPGVVINWLRGLPVPAPVAPAEPPPGPALDELCPNPAHARQPRRGCRGCAADAKAAA